MSIEPVRVPTTLRETDLASRLFNHSSNLIILTNGYSSRLCVACSRNQL